MVRSFPPETKIYIHTYIHNVCLKVQLFCSCSFVNIGGGRSAIFLQYWTIWWKSMLHMANVNGMEVVASEPDRSVWLSSMKGIISKGKYMLHFLVLVHDIEETLNVMGYCTHICCVHHPIEHHDGCPFWCYHFCYCQEIPSTIHPPPHVPRCHLLAPSRINLMSLHTHRMDPGWSQPYSVP